MAIIRRFEEIEAWQAARELVRAIYECSKQGEFSKDFALRDQIRRAAISTMSNIAEGFERDGKPEFIQFLSMAKGSAGEVESHLCVALDQAYISEAQFKELREKARATERLLAGFINYLRTSDIRGQKFKKENPPS